MTLWRTLCGAALLVCCSCSAVEEAEPKTGLLVVDEVKSAFAADRTGVVVGDRLWSWSFEPGVETTTQHETGVLSSPFELHFLEHELAPRGIVRLELSGADGRPRTIEMNSSTWGLEARPALGREQLARYERARSLVGEPERVLALGRELADELAEEGRRLDAAWIEHRVGSWLGDELKFDEAQRALDAALERVDELDLVPRAWLHRRKGYYLAERRDLAAAATEYERAIELWREHRPGGVAATEEALQLATIRIVEGDLAAAGVVLEEAQRRLEGVADASMPMASVIFLQGVLRYQSGDFVAYAEAAERALAIRLAVAPTGPGAAESLHNLGTSLSTLGRLEEAETYLTRALELRRGFELDERVAWTLMSLGKVAAARADNAAARRHYEEAVEILEAKSPSGMAIAGCLVNLGNAARRDGDPDEAARRYRRALEIAEGVAAGSRRVGDVHQVLGELALERGSLAAAEESFRRALEVFEQFAPQGLASSDSAHQLGLVALRRGSPSVARSWFERALEARHRLAPGSTREAVSLFELAKLERASGDVARARALLRRAVDALETQQGRLGGTEESRAGFRARYLDVYHEALDLEVELGDAEEAFHLFERSRARSLLALLATRDMRYRTLPSDLDRARRNWAAAYDRAQLKLARLSPTKDHERYQQVQAELEEIRQRQGELWEAIRRNHPATPGAEAGVPITYEEVRRRLDPGTLVLAYSLGEASSILLAISQREVAARAIPAGRDAIGNQVERLRLLLEKQSPGARDAGIRRRARELADLLLAPAAEEMAVAERLLVLPDRALHLLPFAVLRPDLTGEGARYVLEDWPIHVALSLSTYAHSQSRGAATLESSTAPATELVAFGDPRLPQSARDYPHETRAAAVRWSEVGPLPGSRDEVEQIARLFGERAAAWLGGEATETRAKALPLDTRILHFATHGLLDERSPLDSGLALAPSESDNGLLQAWEVLEGLRLDADLVTLSACGTALGAETTGEGLIGLTRAFHYAGADSIVASLWNISDRSTARLMSDFYQALRDGHGVSESLRAAQLASLSRPETAHPYHWAAFQLFGDWQ